MYGCHPSRPRLAAACSMVLFACLPACVTAGQERTPEALEALVLTSLRREAQRSLGGDLPRQEANARNDFPGKIDPVRFARTMLKPVSRNPTIDAYVRWQMTSFNIHLPEDLDSHGFRSLLAGLPPLQPNPMSNRTAHRFFQRAVEAGVLISSDQEILQDRWDTLQDDTRAQQAGNRPATMLRRWIAAECTRDSERYMQCLVEHIEARITAGWPADSLKHDFEQRCRESRYTRTFTMEERAAVLADAEGLVGSSASWLKYISFDADILIVEYSGDGVYDFDIVQWKRLLWEGRSGGVP